MSTLQISHEFALPLDAQTSTLVIYGGKGMGKTNFGSVLVEELAKSRLRFSVIDPLDVWWGLQHGKDKDKDGIEVLILGGPHGNIPIVPTAGAIVADFVADENVSTVIVLRHQNGTMWSNAERITFVTAYFVRLYARQGEKRIPLMQIVDEAGRFVPQQMMKGDKLIADCVGAIEQMVEWGRNVGVGVCLITQRSARMAKSVSELADCMIAFRTVGPNSITAIVDWLGEHVPKSEQRDWVSQIRSLDRGRALFVSPGWLNHEGVVLIRERETFDSSATPKPGQSLKAPGKARQPDLKRFQDRMAETVEKAKADDPVELRKQIASLKKELAVPQKSAPVADPNAITRAVEDATSPLIRKIDALENLIADGKQEFDSALLSLRNLSARFTFGDSIVDAGHRSRPEPGTGTRQPDPVTSKTNDDGPQDGPPARSGSISKPVQRLIDALAELETMGVSPVPSDQLSVYLGIKVGISTFRSLRADAKNAGLVDYPGNGTVLTDLGRSLAKVVPAKSQHELQEFWLNKLSGPAARMLTVLIAAYPEEVSNDQLAEATGIDRAKSTFRSVRAEIKNAGLCDYLDNASRASALLFPEGLR